MRSNLMASSSMTPLSRAAAPKSPDNDETVRLAAERQMYAAAALPLEAKPKPTADDDDWDDKDKKKKDDDKDSKRGKKAADDDDDDDDKKKKDDDAKALAAGNDERGDRVHMDIDVARHARECERGRLLAILDSEPGRSAFAANPERTLRFALTHPGTRLEAIATLELFGGNLQPAKAPPLRERMGSVRVEVGPDAVHGDVADDPRTALAAAIVAAGRKARGEAA